MHLVACLYNFDFSCENPVIQLSYVAVSKAIELLEITSYTSDYNHYPSNNLRLQYSDYWCFLTFFQIVKELLLP